MPKYRMRDLPILENLKGHTIYYGAQSPWWYDHTPPYLNPAGLPCDPIGCNLMRTPEGLAQDFLQHAIRQQDHYGVHKLDAFRAAYHGVVEVFKAGDRTGHPIWGKDRWIPTAFRTWIEYNLAIDAKKNKNGEFSI